MKVKVKQTLDGEILSALACEWGVTNKDEAEAKIRRRLAAKKLGKYDQNKVDVLRSFKEDVQTEINPYGKSTFYLGAHGKFAAMEDWDLNALIRYFKERHPQVPLDEINRFVPFAVFLYYLK